MMKNERLMALTFIVVGCIGAVALGFVVWQASSPSRPTLDIAMHTTTTTTPTPALYEGPGEEDFSGGDAEPDKQNLAAVDTEDPYLPPNAYVPPRPRVEPASPAISPSAQDQVITSGTGSPNRATTPAVAPTTSTPAGTTTSDGTTPPTTPEQTTRTPEPPTPPSPPRDPVTPTQPSPTPTTTTEESEEVTTPTVPVITTPTVIPPAPTETDTPTPTDTVTATVTTDPPVESPTPTEFQDEPTVPLNPETPVE